MPSQLHDIHTYIHTYICGSCCWHRTIYQQTIVTITIHILCGRVCHKYAGPMTACTTYVLMPSQYPYGYEQHTLARSVGSTLAQAPTMTSDHTTPAEPVVVDGHNGYATVPPEQPLMYRNAVEIDYGQSTSPTVEFNVDEILGYQRQHSSATSEVREPLTPAQRRRKTQNRAAYVSRLSNFAKDPVADTSRWL